MIRFASIQYKAAEANQYNVRHEVHALWCGGGKYVVGVKFCRRMEPKSSKVMRVLERKMWLC